MPAHAGSGPPPAMIVGPTRRGIDVYFFEARDQDLDRPVDAHPETGRGEVHLTRDGDGTVGGGGLAVDVHTVGGFTGFIRRSPLDLERSCPYSSHRSGGLTVMPGG